ncbi:MAG: GDP-mannose 4,6-dehydratase [Candidatus Hodarchaeota archaeon]
MKQEVLVTGGAGFIGSHLCHHLVKKKFEVYCLDNFDPYYDPNLKRGNIADLMKKDNFHLNEGDILDTKLMKKIIYEKNIEFIFHEAAQPGVRFSIKDPVKTNNINVVGTLSILQACLNSNVKKIIFGSSSSIYGTIHYLPFDEDHPKNPLSPYGVSKLAAEHLFRIFYEIYGLDYISLRYFTVFGPRMRPDLAISIFTHNALRNSNIEIFGDGNKTRDFTFIDNIIEANMLAMHKGRGELNIGGNKRVSILDLVKKIIKLTNSSSKIIFLDNIKGDANHTFANIEKAKKILGYIPKINLEEGLKNFIYHVKSNLK